MVTADEVKTKINNVKRTALKILAAETVLRRKQIYDGVHSRLNTIMSQLSGLITVSKYELATNYMLQRYYLSKANQVGLKSIEFDYNDETVNMTGLDNATYDNPVFPQIQLTSDELQQLEAAIKDVPKELRKAVCVLRVPAGQGGGLGEADASDSVFDYYFADGVGVMEYHGVDYSHQIFGLPEDEWIKLKMYAYQTADPLLTDIVELNLELVEAESLILSFSGGKVVIGVDIRPTLTLSNPADTTVKRKTTALFVLNVDNDSSANGTILIDRFEVPLIAGKHYLAIVGAEITGLRNIEVVYQV